MNAPRHHDLKVWPQQFDALAEGRKTFEVRPNDRDYAVGDVLDLNEYGRDFTGRRISAVVVHIEDFEPQEGFVVLGLLVPPPEHPEMSDIGRDPRWGPGALPLLSGVVVVIVLVALLIWRGIN